MYKVPCPKDKNHTFTQVSNSFIRDRRLSSKAKGLFLFLLSQPPTWCFNYQSISNSFSDGHCSIKSSIRELISFGYMTLYIHRHPNKTFRFFDYTIYETPIETTSEPLVGFPLMDKPLMDKPLMDKPLMDPSTMANNKNKITQREETTTIPTKVVNTKAPVDVSLLKKQIDKTQKLFDLLGIVNHKVILDKYDNSDILKYASWMYSVKPKYENATAFLVSAITDKWDISQPSDDSNSFSDLYQYECTKCHIIHKYPVVIPDYKLCNKCAGRKY